MTKFHSALWLNKIPFTTFLIHLSAVGHLGCFHSMASVNNAAINVGMQVPLE
jgi:hypothetical protein